MIPFLKRSQFALSEYMLFKPKRSGIQKLFDSVDEFPCDSKIRYNQIK